jgi:NAD(P)H-hydrate epimerase
MEQRKNNMSSVFLTRDQTREIDRRAIEEYGMAGAVLMENAGRGCADVLCNLGIEGRVVICCGKGNNGGDGFVIARHLELRDVDVKVLVWGDPPTSPPDAARNFDTLKWSEIALVEFGDSLDREQLKRELDGANWLVDALLGTGARGDPQPPLDLVVTELNEQNARKLAIDIPTGLDCDSGQPSSITLRADHTCTFVAQKAGFQFASARPFLGNLHVIDIGVPKKLLREMNAI